jgi:lipid-binding SYLF domain-containing protein
MNERGMKHLLSDKFTVGGDASAAAGPLGRESTAQTDAMMHAEMLSYSRSRGLFAGISLEGATLRPDTEANFKLYAREAGNREILAGEFKTPPIAQGFECALNQNSQRRRHYR